MSKLIKHSWCAGILVAVLLLQICLPSTVWADDEEIEVATLIAMGTAYLGLSIGGFWAASRSLKNGRSGPMKTWLVAAVGSFAFGFIATGHPGAGIAVALPVAGLASILHRAIVPKKSDNKESNEALFNIGKDAKSIRFPLLRYDAGTQTIKKLPRFRRNPRWSIKLLSVALSP